MSIINTPLPVPLNPLTANITSGSYVGDNTANRAIPHGLGVIPTLVEINHWQPSYWVIKSTLPHVLFVLNATLDHRYTMPDAMDDTYFYVGVTGSMNYSANDPSSNMLWVAFS